MIDLERLQAGLTEHYEIERELGRGGMATVFLANDVRLGRKVAIKVLHPDLAAAVGAERFRREIEIVTALSHPNILSIYDSGESSGYLYYVMPLVEGESLRDLLLKQRQLSIDDAVRIAVQVAAALDYAHRHDVLHRDIKPENILIEDGQAIVADFGVARALSAAGDMAKLTQTGMAIGTPTYMSPEQALADRNLDGRSDQYALGCVIYEMLAGQPPFVGVSMQSLVMAHAMAAVPSLRIARQTVSEDLEAVVLRSLAKAPADRWPNLKEFSQALVAPTNVTWSWRAAGTAMYAVPPQAAASAARRRLQMFAGALVVVLGLGGGLAAWSTTRSDNATAASVVGENATRIAVTYFADGSADRSLGYLADGLTESLIDQLDRVDGLDVISAEGVAPFRGDGVPIDSVVRALGVGTVVRGSVAPDGENLRVTITLVDGPSGADVERRTFTTAANDPLALRDSLGVEVANFLRIRLGRELRVRQQRAETSSPAAWILVRRAAQAERDAESLAERDDEAGAAGRFTEADELLRNAAAADPRWAEPYTQRAWLAYRQSRLAHLPTDQIRLAEQAMVLADSALRRNTNESRALEARGTARYFLYLASLIPDQREAKAAFEEAERDLVAATQRAPDNASAWTTLSHLYSVKPDFAQAKLAAMRAYEQDAFLTRAADIVNRLYQSSYLTETFTDASDWCREGYRRFPADVRFMRCQLWLLTVPRVAPTAMPDSAWRLVEALDAVSAEFGRREARVAAAIVLGRAELADSASRVLERVRTTSEEVDPNGDLLFYEAYARLTMGDRDAALRLLGEYVSRNPEHREGWLKDSAWWWRDLENDARFRRLMATSTH